MPATPAPPAPPTPTAAPPSAPLATAATPDLGSANAARRPTRPSLIAPPPRVVPLATVAAGVLPSSAQPPVPGLRGGGGAASPRLSIASDVFDNTFGEAEAAGSELGVGSSTEGGYEGGYVGGGHSSRRESVDESSGRSGASPPPHPPPPSASHDSHLPKPAHLIKAEMGIKVGKEGQRDVIEVSLADDLEALTAQWCAARGVSEKARAKVVSALRTRLDEALALAYQEQEREAQAQPPTKADDAGVC